MKRNAWIAGSIGFVVLLLVVVAVRVSRTRPTPPPKAAKAKIEPNRKGYYKPPRSPETPATQEEIGTAMNKARLQSTYRNFRTAVATGNTRLQASLRGVLLRDADEVLKLAQEDLNSSKSSADQAIAMKAMEALKP